MTKARIARISDELNDALGRVTFEKNLSGNAIIILAVEKWIKENSEIVSAEYAEALRKKHENRELT